MKLFSSNLEKCHGDGFDCGIIHINTLQNTFYYINNIQNSLTVYLIFTYKNLNVVTRKPVHDLRSKTHHYPYLR